MGFLDKLKAGLKKTKNAIFGKINDMLKAFVKVDEDMLDEGEMECPNCGEHLEFDVDEDEDDEEEEKGEDQ